MHQVLLLCLAVFVYASSPPLERTIKLEWEKFKKTHNKTYKTNEEELSRYQIFRKKSILIAEHNKNYSDGLVSYFLGINQFADRTQGELKKMTSCAFEGPSDNNRSTFVPPADVHIPDAVDWRQYGAVTPVKNQLRCGSCWAFSTTGAVEAQHFLKTRNLVSLSEQNLVDCSTRYNNYGCRGGWPANAMQYIKDNGGIDTEQSYPYNAMDGTCHFSRSNIGATVRTVIGIRPGFEADLMVAVATIGPVSVALDAERSTFVSYKGGVYDDPYCRRNSANHAVLIVGYGTIGGRNYWIVKNSWGPNWGVEGYIYMARGNNECGIANHAYIPLE